MSTLDRQSAQNGRTENMMSAQPNISLVPKKDANGKPIADTVDGTLVRIRLFDDRERVLFFKDNASPTARQVCEMIASKLSLQPESVALFSLWIAIPDLELQIRPKMEVFDMVKKWPRWVEKYTHAQNSDNHPVAATYKLVFKREAMVTRQMETRLTDPAAIKLLYGEARSAVMAGRYPLASVDEAAELAAFQTHILHGDYSPSKHGPGTSFLAQSLNALIPKYFLPRGRTIEWEQRICNFWSKLAGRRDLQPYAEFLDHVRNWPVYGSTFFPACKNIPPSGYFELRTDHLWVAVNAEGLTIVDEDKHKASWHGNFQGIEWECTPDSITIEYTPPRGPADQPPPKKMGSTLITPQSHLIDSLASRAIYNIEKQERHAARLAASGGAAGNTVRHHKEGSNGSTIRGGATLAARERKQSQPPSIITMGEVFKSATMTSDGSPVDAGSKQSSSPASPTTPTSAGHLQGTPPATSGNSKRISTDARPETTMIVHDDKEDPSEYLKAMKEVRKPVK